jgi:TPP-dependent pyruvate/acetoin dehydrogenase alpha subunit
MRETTQIELLEKMILIRRAEERLLELFGEGALSGTTHACIGQEANSAGLISNLTPSDTIFATHRCHGHYLAYTDDLFGLFSELMGKQTGPSGGRGGSQHLCRGNFYSSGVQGGFMASAAGIALAEQKSGTRAISVPIIGDGTLGEGAVYEVLNVASLWRLPLLTVIENNLYAQSTSIRLNLAGSIVKRIESFGIETIEVSSFDAEEIREKSGAVIAAMRQDGRPRGLVLNTYRFCSHSKSDDNRDAEEIQRWMANDPIELMAEKVDSDVRDSLERKIRCRIQEEEERARVAPLPGQLPSLDLDEVMAL